MEGAPVEVVDVKGTWCPTPIIETARAVKRVEIGESVLVLSTDPGVKSDMPAWCRATGQQLLSLTQEGEVFHALVRRAR